MIDINRILYRNNVSTAMTVRTDDPTGWLVPFCSEARAFCEQSEAHFAFVESVEMQAVAIQDEGVDVVAMYAGMFWVICRLAAAVANSGVFPTMAGEKEPAWKPDPVKTSQVPRKLLQEGTQFDWELESAGWKDHPERQILFYAALSILFRFVLFHEIGHLRNDHGRRRKARSLSPVQVDAVNSFARQCEEAIPSQAREIIADSFALKMTLEVLDREMSLKADLEMTRILRDKLMPDQEALVRFVLIVVYVFFRISGGSNWHEIPLDRLSHPPAPFRMKALMAALLEHRHLGISEEAAERSVREASAVGEAVMSVVLGIYPDPYWFQRISTPEYDAHFECLFQELPHWSGRLSRDVRPKPMQT